MAIGDVLTTQNRVKCSINGSILHSITSAYEANGLGIRPNHLNKGQRSRMLFNPRHIVRRFQFRVVHITYEIRP